MSRICLLLFLSLFMAGPARGETIKMSLRESVSTALEKNHRIKSAASLAEGARQGVASVESRYYPGIALEEQFTASDAPTQTFMMKLDQGRFSQNDFQIGTLNHPGVDRDFRTAITAHIPLYVPSTAPTRAVAVKEAEKETFSLETVRQEVAFQVFRLYLHVQKAAAQVLVSDQGVADARENLRLAAVRNQAGTGLKSEELRARTHLAMLEQQSISARNNLVITQMQLAMTLGLEPGSRVEAQDAPVVLATAGKEPDFPAVAREERQDLRRVRAELERSEAGVALARSAYLPTLGASASYQMHARNAPFSSDNDSWMAGLTLSWQLFDGFGRSSERNRAAALRLAAEESLRSHQDEVAFQVTESLLRREEMLQRREVARRAVAGAEETARIVSKRFENELATMVELLDAQTALNQARATLLASEADATLASGAVYHASGIFLKEMLQ